MIISHRNKYIFFKALKTAGTSVEVALARSCGLNDIITPIAEENRYKHPSKNYKGFFNHIKPLEIKEKIDKEIWKSYFKFTIIRNPWDETVSRCCYYFSSTGDKKALEMLKSSDGRKEAMNIFLNKRLKNKQISNEDYYFIKNLMSADSYMKYHQLEYDFKTICNKLEIPYEKLPKFKTKQRNRKIHYTDYYTIKSANRIANLREKEIKTFKWIYGEN